MRKQWRSWRLQQAPSPSWPNPCRSWLRWSSMWRAWRRPWWSLRWDLWPRTRERENSNSAANIYFCCLKSSVIAVLLFRLTSRRCHWGSWVRGRSRARTLSLLKSTRWVTSDQAHVGVPSSDSYTFFLWSRPNRQQAVSDCLPEAQILDLSNRFYTLIPHDFGMKKPPLLSNLDYIQVWRTVFSLFITESF